ncbi:uncharacterized protein At4g38062 isoform X1 [Malania oleifera]|nr:uncharacterized protein At4g38062 isoform X1 [Malania oleifera]
MDRVYRELDEAKVENEKLKAEYRIKAELSESLKKAHNEELAKIQRLSLKIDKQAEELNEKAEEISSFRQMCEELKCNLNEKDGIIRSLSSANEKLRVDCTQKLKKSEQENKEMAMALDEANGKNIDQEQKIRAFKDEIESLKEILSVSQRKRSEAEEKARVPKELRQRDDMLLKLERESRKVEDQLKWKKEQFKHLEDAHEKLRGQFCTSKKEWDLEKSSLLDDLCSLQTSLDSQTRISEDLQNRLKMCNQALAHEESRRKHLEFQLSEYKMRFENVFSECQEAKLKMEDLTIQRDREIAALRTSLDTKRTLYKEMDYKAGKLEQENQELRVSLKEFQEAKIHEAGTSSSLGKLRGKLKNLEQMHRSCSANLRAKEEEWRSQMERLIMDLNDCRSELEGKDMAIKELKLELEGCHSSIMQLKLLNEENSVMLLVLKSAFAEAKSMLDNEKAEMDLHNKEKQENISHLMKELEMKNAALLRAQLAIEEEHEKAASLLRRADSLDLIEQQQFVMQKELERHKEMLEESSMYQLRLKDQALQMESDFREKLREVCDALDAANSELAEKICDGSEAEFELQVWKSIAERLKVDLEGNHEKRREIELSLLAQVEVEETLKQEKDSLICELEERGRRIDSLQQQIGSLDQELEKMRAETEAVKSKQVNAEAKDKTLEKHQEEFERLEELVRIKLEDVEKTFQYEKGHLLQLVEEKDQKIDNLQQLVQSFERNSDSLNLSFSSQLAQKQAEIDLIHKAWQKIATDEVLKAQELQETKLMIVELENNISDLCQKLELQEKSLSCSKREAQEMKADLEAKQLEVKIFTDQLENKLRATDASLNKLGDEKVKLLDNITKLSSERESLLSFVGDLWGKIGRYSSEDMQLMRMLESIVQTLSGNEMDVDLNGGDELFFNSIKENVSADFSPAVKKFEVIPNERSPFRELND